MPDQVLSSADLDTDVQSRILDLAARDKESALIRLGIEIEKESAIIQQSYGALIPQRGISWSDTISDLEGQSVIPKSITRALMDFRNVRNRVVHATSGSGITEHLITSAIDSGLRIYRLLKATPRGQSAVDKQGR